MKKIAGVLSLVVFGIGLLYASDVLDPIINFGDSPMIVIKRARGQSTDKEHVYSGDILSGISGYGYGLTAWGTTAGVAIKMKANQNWTATAQGTKITFETTPDGSTTAAEVMSIDDDGNVAITGGLTQTGAVTLGAASKLVFTPSATLIGVSTATTEIRPLSSYVKLYANDDMTLTGTPTISTASIADGTYIVLTSTAGNITLQNSDALADTCLDMEAASLVVTTSTARAFIFDLTNLKWRHVQ